MIQTTLLRRVLVLVLLVLLLSSVAESRAADTRVLPEGKLPQDRRLGALKTLDDYFPFHPCATPDAWAARSERLRRQILVATGLWPMPTRTPANAVVHGLVDREQYTVERVRLESVPGHYVTGSLYRPKGLPGRLPGVLCPHGHWENGRFYEADAKRIERDLANGGEKYAVGGRSPLQARCVQLARMGCVVFHYDMEGYADSVQLPHRPGVRAEMNTERDWGYFSPQAEARLQNMMGLQTYNSVRVLDWFSELPDVDPKRIGVTGASGGGTQTFILCAIDSRPAAAFPAVMVSTAMQGGCTCENAPYLRIDTGNVEIAALTSPRPLGMTAANDWTKEMETKGFPELKQHYRMLRIEDKVGLTPLLQFDHNYNYPSRAAMYEWMNAHLKLGHKPPVVEEDFRPLSRGELTCWDDQHTKPSGGLDHERALLRWLTADTDKQMAELMPADAPALAAFRRIVGGAVDVMIGRGLPKPDEIKGEKVDSAAAAGFCIEKWLVHYKPGEEETPLICLRPEKWNKRAVVWLSREGKQHALFDGDKPRAAVAQLLAAGTAVVGVDLYGQGEFCADGKPMGKNRMRMKQGKSGEKFLDFAGYTYGYNHSLFAQRVHDVLTTVAFLRSCEGAERVDVIGLNGAGHWVAAARAQAGAAIDRAVVDTARFRFGSLKHFDDGDFLPGGAKYFDLPGILALSAPLPLWLADGDNTPPVVASAYRTVEAEANLHACSNTNTAEKAADALRWLTK